MAKELRNLLIHRLLEPRLERAGRAHFTGRLLDIGCGTKPYRSMFADVVDEHVGLDHAGSFHDTSNVDLLGTAYEIPAPDDSFDCAVSTAVLEHLEEPEQALRECHRVLKPEAVAVYTVPFIWHIHERPRDFYRFSKYGLRYLFEKAGFEVVEIEALSGFWATFGQLFVYNLYRFHRGVLRFVPVIPLVGLGVQGISYVLDRLDKAEDWTWMYLVVARKRTDGGTTIPLRT